MLVREPDQLWVERKHPHPAFSGRLVELAEPHRHVTADNDRTLDRIDMRADASEDAGQTWRKDLDYIFERRGP